MRSIGVGEDRDFVIWRESALQGTELALSLQNAHGRQIALDVLLNVDQTTRHVTGTLRAVS